MNVLILTGKFGMGHLAAACSLRQQLLQGFPNAAVTVEDFPAYVLPNASTAIYKIFDLVVTHGSHLFNTYYKLTALGHADARRLWKVCFWINWQSFWKCAARMW